MTRLLVGPDALRPPSDERVSRSRCCASAVKAYRGFRRGSKSPGAIQPQCGVSPLLQSSRPSDQRRGEIMTDVTRGLMLNMSTVDPAHEDEFNQWYHAE